METKGSDERINELIELMDVPEVRQIILAKFEQTKLIFKNEIREFYKKKYPNLLEFPRIPLTDQNRDMGKTPNHVNPQDGQNRIEWKHRRGFFDTTRYVGLSEEKQVEVFLKYFKTNREFRREILFEFFLKKMPYSDTYENAG